MTASPPPHIGGIFQRIRLFGDATEKLFSRLHRGLSWQKAQQEQAQRQADIEKRNRKLRRLLRHSHMEVEKLEAILDNISEGVILQDLDGRVIKTNPASLELLGGSERNIWTSEIGGLLNAYRDVNTVPQELTPLGEPYRVQVGKRLLGAQVVALANANGIRFGTLILLKDITRDELSYRLKNSFVTHISHELRTPLAPMRVASEILLNTPEGKAPNRRMLELISRNIDVLDRMVNEMIDISAMSSGQFEIRREVVAIEPLLVDLMDEFADDVLEAKLDIRLMLRDVNRLYVMGDAKYLRWALSNLLRNAIAYNQPNQHISVRARLETRATVPHVLIDVADSGVGISEEDLPHVFELFYRGQARTQDGKRIDPRGLGQGLFVAKVIVEAHEGYLAVQSKLYEGSVFTLGVPAYAGNALNEG
jgi:signal transduction histidine kinase